MSNKEMVQVKHCQIHLTEPARSNAAEARWPMPRLPLGTTIAEARAHHLEYADAYQARREFTGPHFHGVDDVTVTEGVVVVQIGGTEYAYPLHAVARVKSYTTEHTPE